MPVLPDDPFETPEFKAYAKHVRDTLIPMITDSAVTMSIVPGDNKPDVKFAVELGFMIMLDKPIIAIVSRDAKVPLKLAKVADEIVEGEIDDPDFQGRMTAAIDRVMKKLGKGKA
jgi:nucleoside 2-deoxyribosyltransferase